MSAITVNGLQIKERCKRFPQISRIFARISQMVQRAVLQQALVPLNPLNSCSVGFQSGASLNLLNHINICVISAKICAICGKYIADLEIDVTGSGASENK